MSDEVSATTMVNYFTNCTAQLRGRAVYVQFSNHKELKTDQTHSNAVSHSTVDTPTPPPRVGGEAWGAANTRG